MYADRYAKSAGVKPGSLIVAVAINAGVIGALLLSTPVVHAIRERGALEIINIPADPPPPEPAPPEAKPQPDDRVASPPDQVMTTTALTSDTSNAFVLPPPLPLPPLPTLSPYPAGEAVTIDPPAPPVLVEARIDPRYARDLQPAYPAGERRAEREGKATVRVTIARDGRVTTAECVAATSDDFCRATRQQALSKWRFAPATRDGVPVETTKEMTVRFELES